MTSHSFKSLTSMLEDQTDAWKPRFGVLRLLEPTHQRICSQPDFGEVAGSNRSDTAVESWFLFDFSSFEWFPGRSGLSCSLSNLTPSLASPVSEDDRVFEGLESPGNSGSGCNSPLASFIDASSLSSSRPSISSSSMKLLYYTGNMAQKVWRSDRICSWRLLSRISFYISTFLFYTGQRIEILRMLFPSQFGCRSHAARKLTFSVPRFKHELLSTLREANSA